jgi:Glycosyl transferases group 1
VVPRDAEESGPRVTRVFLSTINYDHPQKGQIDAFAKLFGGANVQHFDYLQEQRDGRGIPDINARFIRAAWEFRPDWIWLHLQETGIIQWSTLAEVKKLMPKVPIVQWMGDCRRAVSPYLASICNVADLTCISSVGQMQLFMQAGAREVRYLQIGLDWDEDVLGQPPWTPPFQVPQVAFCGGYYGDLYPGTVDRVRGVQALRSANLDVGIVGGGWPAGFPVVGTCTVKQQHHVWKRAKVAVNINHFNDIQNYYSDRQIIAMASGTPLVCRYVPGLESEFTHGTHCLWYNDDAELVAHVRTLLGNPALAQKIGQAGREEVLRNHTWESRIRDLMPDVERLRRNP